MAERPLRPAKDHWLGRPLPFQLPNPPRAHHKAVLAFEYKGFYPSLYGKFPRVTHPFAIERAAKPSIQLACVKPIARVHSGPGSNPTVKFRRT